MISHFFLNGLVILAKKIQMEITEKLKHVLLWNVPEVRNVLIYRRNAVGIKRIHRW